MGGQREAVRPVAGPSSGDLAPSRRREGTLLRQPLTGRLDLSLSSPLTSSVRSASKNNSLFPPTLTGTMLRRSHPELFVNIISIFADFVHQSAAVLWFGIGKQKRPS